MDIGVNGWISPVHTDSESGKPHRQFLLKFPHPRSYDQVMKLLQDRGINDPDTKRQTVNTVRYAPDEKRSGRYLCHLDEDDKEHYKPEDVITMGSIPYSVFLDAEVDEKDTDTSLFELIEKYRCRSYSQLVRYCTYVEPKFYRAVCGRCGFWSAYLKSLSMDPNSAEMEYIISEKKGKQNDN